MLDMYFATNFGDHTNMILVSCKCFSRILKDI